MGNFNESGPVLSLACILGRNSQYADRVGPCARTATPESQQQLGCLGLHIALLVQLPPCCEHTVDVPDRAKARTCAADLHKPATSPPPRVECRHPDSIRSDPITSMSAAQAGHSRQQHHSDARR